MPNWRRVMTVSARLLILGGLALAAFGMLYGLHYALFVEHQTLDQLGGSLAQAFMHAADGIPYSRERLLKLTERRNTIRSPGGRSLALDRPCDVDDVLACYSSG